MLKKLKKNKIIRKIYFGGRNLQISILSRISPKRASIVFYNRCHKKKINLKNPQTFNEKLMYLKIKNYNKNKNVYKCSDKYLIRDYAKSKGVHENNLPKIIGIYKSPKEIDFKKLPKKFVLKCSHGCGFNIICKDKKKIDRNETIKKLNKWKRKKYGYSTAETHYTHVKPTIFCEEFIQNEDGSFPNDYKIYCFHGEPKLVLVCSEREKKLKLNFYDLEWKELLIGTENYRGTNKIVRPKKFNEMIDIAKKVSKDFPYVRVDLYEYRDKAILGEMTFTPAGCVSQYYTDEGQIYLGKLLDINK